MQYLYMMRVVSFICPKSTVSNFTATTCTWPIYYWSVKSSTQYSTSLHLITLDNKRPSWS